MQSNSTGLRRLAQKTAALLAVTALLLLVGMAAVSLLPQGAAAAPAAQFGAVTAPRTVTLYGPTAVTTGTTFSSAPLNVNGIDNARTTNYGRADVFISTGANSSGTLTVTVQVSADESTWADSTEMQQGFLTGTLVSAAYTHRVVLTGASQAGTVRVPLAGEFLRVKVEAAGSITPTVKATYR